MIQDIEPKNGLYGKAPLKEFLFRDYIGLALVDMHFWFLDDKFIHAELKFKSGYFAVIESAFKERYGDPELTETNELQNRLGAKFENKSLYWAGSKIQITLQKYRLTTAEGRATVGEKIFLQERTKQMKEMLGGGGKDL